MEKDTPPRLTPRIKNPRTSIPYLPPFSNENSDDNDDDDEE